MGRRLDELSRTIIGSSYEVANVLGRGFVEKVYANALSLELEDQGFKARREVPIKVYYKKKITGDFFVDLFVEGLILVETKATGSLNNLHMAQCLNYLNASGLSLCLLINFDAPSVQVKRVVNNF